MDALNMAEIFFFFVFFCWLCLGPENGCKEIKQNLKKKLLQGICHRYYSLRKENRKSTQCSLKNYADKKGEVIKITKTFNLMEYLNNKKYENN